MRATAVAIVLIGAFLPLSPAQTTRPSEPESPLSKILYSDTLSDAEAALAARVRERDTPEARFALAIAQTARSAEKFVQFAYRHGWRSDSPSASLLGLIGIPVRMVPNSTNPEPEPLGYEQLRSAIQEVRDGLQGADATLQQLKPGDFKLGLNVAMLGFDVDADGKVADAERFGMALRGLMRGRGPADADVFLRSFDYADAVWLRGYLNLLQGSLSFLLAHDFERQFNHLAHVLFRDPVTPYPFLKYETREPFNEAAISDLIVTVRLSEMPVRDAAESKRALEHFLAFARLGQELWVHVGAERDDDREWIAGPRQTPPFRGLEVSLERIATWRKLLGEFERILAGERLVPFWRGDKRQGVNIRRAFLEPRVFDCWLWFQGPAAVPYFEDGEMTDFEIWSDGWSVFRFEIVTWGLWAN